MTNTPSEKKMRLAGSQEMTATASIGQDDAAFRVDGELFKLFFDQSLVGMAVGGPGKRLISVNDKLCRMLGYDRDELLKKPFEELTHPGDRAQNSALLDAVLSGERDGYTLEKRCIQKNGDIFYAHTTTQSLRVPDGSANYFISMFEDVTDRVKAAAALRRDAGLLAATEEVSRIGGWEWDEINAKIFWTDQLNALYGFSPNEVPTSRLAIEKCLQYYDAEDRPLIMEAFNQCRKKGQPYDLEFPFTTAAGRRIWVRTVAKPVMQEGKVLKVVGNLMDITDRKQMEEALRHRESKYRLLYDNAPIPYQSLDENGRLVDVNQAWLDTLGYSREAVIGKFFGDLLPPEDLALFKDNFTRFKATGSVSNIEFGLVKKDDTRILVSLNGTVARDQTGHSLQTHCVFKDITAQKAAVKALKKSERQLRESVASLEGFLKSAPVGVGIVRDRVIQRINRRFGEMLGYTEQELIGKHARCVYPTDEDFERVGREKYSQIREKGVGMVETRLQCKDGKNINVLLSSAALHPGDPSQGLVFTALDITARKAAAIKLEQRERYYRTIIDSLQEDIFILGADYRIRDVNRAMVAHSGLRREDLIGRFCYAVSHRSSRPCDQMGENCRLKEVFETGEVRKCLHAHQLKDGAIRWVDILLSPMKDRNGNSIAVIESMRDVTDFIKVKKTVEESEAFSKSIIASSADCIKVLDSDGRLLFMSDGGQKLMEIDDIAPYLNESWTDFWKGEDNAAARRAISEAQKGGVGTFQCFRATAKGTPKWWDIIVSPIPGEKGHLLAVSRDITGQRARQAELKRLAAAIEQAAESVEITDTETKIVYVNPAFEKITGYCRDEVVGQSPRLLKGGGHSPSFYRDMWDTISNGKVWRGRLGNKRKDGSLFYEDASISPVFDSDGEIINYVAVKRDVTQEIESEKRLQLAQKMESIGTLAGGIAHDFNNILSAVLGFTELSLDDVEKGSPLEDNLQEVFVAGKRAKDLVRQILAFARQSDAEAEPIQVDTITKEVLKFMRSSIPATIEIRQNIASDSLIMGSATQVHQILMNLCTNAAQAMDKEGGILEVGLKDVADDGTSSISKLSLKPDDYIEIKVSDTGVGIPPESIDKIFEPYFTTKSSGDGSGLGLSMVHGIVESCGGKITVDSQLGKGTVFTIYLPVVERRQAHRPYESEQLPSGTERILFVDDEAPIGKMGSQILERMGYQVTVCSSSAEALELFRSKPDDFDLAVTDMTMPDISGDKLSAALMQVRADIPVILCTGYSQKIPDEAVSQIGIKALVFKPIVMGDLAKTVRRVLDEAEGKI